MPAITEDDVARLEIVIDSMNVELEPLQEFILPGGGLPTSFLHMARTVCRRAERTLCDSVAGGLRRPNAVDVFEPPERCPLCVRALGGEVARRTRAFLAAFDAFDNGKEVTSTLTGSDEVQRNSGSMELRDALLQAFHRDGIVTL